ncbi:MAG: hypothetical protein IIX36_07900, partial [Clostridia bacterium]|nr:hypothetical protein [Clostridia bacterium]
MPYTWNVNGKSIVCDKAGVYTESKTLSCGVVTWELTLDVTNDDKTIKSSDAVCESDLPYTW